MDAYIGEIRIFAGTFAPDGWFFCDGSIYRIADYQALYAIVSNKYGGSASSGTFAVPDLRGRAPMHWGYGPGLTPRQLAQTGGNTSAQLTYSNMPLHSHAVNATATNGTLSAPTNASYMAKGYRPTAIGPQKIFKDYVDPPANVPMNATIIGSALGNSSGGVDAHDNRQPYLVVNYIINWDGTFPPQP